MSDFLYISRDFILLKLEVSQKKTKVKLFLFLGLEKTGV